MENCQFKQSSKTFIGIIAIFCVSAVLFIATHGDSAVHALAAIPLVGSLTAALFQLFRDQAKHERTLITQESQNNFVLGASSHMANVAFDKHVQFSEAYVHEAQKALLTLLQKGPSEEVLNHAASLHEIRNKYIIWLTHDLENNLDPFEAALRTIGAKAGYVEDTRGDEKSQKDRSKAIEILFNTFAKVMNFKEWDGKTLTDELAISALIQRLRAILGTEELMQMRSSIIVKAATNLKTRTALNSST